MPILYTAFIEDRTITNGADFLKLCTRNFGIASDIRDEPLPILPPIHFEPDPYYEQTYKRAVERNNKVQHMTFEEAKQEIIEKCKSEAESSRIYYEDCIENNHKYLKIKKEVLNWIPPTKEHENIKKFALEQIDTCITSEKDLRRYNLDADLKDAGLYCTDKEVQEYLDDKKQYEKDNVKSAYQRWQEAIKDAEMKNLWMRQFLDSLGTISNEMSVSEEGE